MKDPNKRKIKENTVITVTQGMGALELLIKTFPKMSRTNVKSLLTYGQVTSNYTLVTRHDHKFVAGDVVQINWNKDRTVSAKLKGLKVLFEDMDILVVEKDKGILSVSTGKKDEATAYNTLKLHVKSQHPDNKIFIVHRLDRDTSGVMIFAKTVHAKRLLQTEWTTYIKKRTYIAVVEGVITEDQGTVHSWLTENSQFQVYSSPVDNGGKESTTHFEVRRRGKQFTMVEATLETGRKNQIRIHMKELGFPIVGDKKYGATSNPILRLGLHAQTISFIHPITKEELYFTSKIPPSFLKLVR
ncbi:RluA family pseudouridine synthase [Myxococcota bacterium]|nr:RluA family pseudouridine synthase [Myxococcota bacterium]